MTRLVVNSSYWTYLVLAMYWVAMPGTRDPHARVHLAMPVPQHHLRLHADVRSWQEGPPAREGPYMTSV